MKTCQICDPKRKIEKVMHEFKEGKLRSHNSKNKVTSRQQAIAIALSESRQACSCKKSK